MNARAILKRLREEQKVREETATTEETDEKETTTATSSSRSQYNNTISTTRYEDAVLTERRVQIATTRRRQSRGADTVDTRDDRSSLTIHLLEDPTGSWAGGNGATLWDCALALTEVLVPRYTSSSTTTSSSMLEPPPIATTMTPDPLQILELGAGLGLCGIAMAACGNSFPGRRRRPHHVLVTERAIAVPLLQRNVENYTTKNTTTTTTTGNNTNNNVVRVAELKWGRKATQDLVRTERRHRRKTTTATCVPSPVFDVIIMSDLIFPSNSDNYALLVDTLVVILLDDDDNNNNDDDNNDTIDDDGNVNTDFGISTTTTTSTTSSTSKSHDKNRRLAARTVDVYLSYEPRQPEIEATFWTLLQTAGIYAQRIPKLELPKTHPEDIYIYTLSTTEEENKELLTNRVGDEYGRA